MSTWESPATLRGRFAVQIRHHPDADHTALYHELKAAVLAGRITKFLTANPLPIEQRHRLAALLLDRDAS